MKYSFPIVILLFCACGTPPESPEVKLAGSLRGVMHQGQLGAIIKIDSVLEPGVYALGALDSLAGEILILDGDLLVSTVLADSVQTGPIVNVHAALLVYAQVGNWQEFELSTENWEETVLEYAQEQELEQPFPFMFKGAFPRLDYHVINYDTQKGDLSNHKSGAFKSQLDQTPVTILGFYSQSHQGLFTHHDAFTHMHVRNADGTAMGHVDYLESGNGSFTLLLPKP